MTTEIDLHQIALECLKELGFVQSDPGDEHVENDNQ
jgi:hypothetical protein